MMESGLAALLERIVGKDRTATLLATTAVEPTLMQALATGGRVPRAVVAQALAMLLFDDLLARVPSGRAYVADVVARGERITFDHGALRTVASDASALPPGRAAFDRILEPLGYAVHATYPLDRLRMTGYAFAHRDFPESVPQYFVSELHPERLTPLARDATLRIIASAHDPLDPGAYRALAELTRDGSLALHDAAALVPALAACFACTHAPPALEDYELLREESPEMAWIATEGNAFNHATDRVTDVEALARAQRASGRPIKDAVEVSASGTIRQTAFRADPVERQFVVPGGAIVMRTVPGSFYEFISRARDADGRLDLRFDAGNATAIFRMTAAPGV